MIMFKEGTTVGEFIKALQTLPQEKLLRVACDEEFNTVYNGVFIEEAKNCIVIAGLDTTEVDEWDK